METQEIIQSFHNQFDYQPVIKNINNFKNSKDIFAVGMGGSHLAADLINDIFKEIDIKVHSDYGLPNKINKDSLLIVSSFSGNTEETIDALNSALKKKIPLIIVSSGGKLIEIAIKNNLPYIQLPDNTIPPRMALGYSIKAFLKILNKNLDFKVSKTQLQKRGFDIAKKIKGTIPLIYSSSRNRAISYIWKINFNENSKNPAFTNYFPELNHNEMVGLGNNNFSFILIEDDNDHLRVKKRIKIFKKNYQTISIKGNAIYLIILSLWASYYLALENKVDPQETKIIDNLKEELSR
ncbi:MAG: bifunctional phosphoglucose/phosphomannose isomerase [Candidatus Pacebacteria bacterium]|nr:bifunctional phosphoglucose/phosphomannose isomerase [Candidatus Paceibacterota bacterium]MDD4073974.1 bifunctional phosphoglucose/phosphomannose isomerase [Candidatus Paceibacterota bacterium]